MQNGKDSIISVPDEKDSYFRKSIVEDVFDLAPRVCEKDQEEIWRSHKSNPIDSLSGGYYASHEVYTIIHQGIIKGMVGVNRSTLDNRIGIPWMLTDGNFKGFELKFLREGKRWLDSLLTSDWDLLFNYVDVDNVTAIKWLKFLKFSFVRIIPEFGYAKTPFVEFMRIKNV